MSTAPSSVQPGAVLADLRRSRRRRRTQDFDPFEALYRVYITAIVGSIAVWLISGVIGDSRVRAATALHVSTHGAPVVGAAVGLAWAVGLRSGGRGGPLVMEGADVRHVLLSPIERSVALRLPAIRQLRFGAFMGAGAGAVAGLLAYRRLPGGFPAWVGCGIIVGAVAVLGALGLAMVVSGLRLGRWIGSILALAMLGWSAADLATNTVSSPATWLGALALWPLQFRLGGLIGVAFAALAAGAGVVVIGGTSIEAAERRASLVGQIRFAATLRDLRTVVVLRRQLSQELPRQRPWLRLPRSVPATWLVPASPTGTGVTARPAAKPRWFPAWRRGWHGIFRFPALRFARLAVLGVVAGLALVEVWRGTTPLVIVAGLALYVAGLDAVEPLAQELDHPDRMEEYAIPAGTLLLREVAPSVLLMVLVAVVGVVAGAAASGGNELAWKVGGLLVLPAAACGVGGAAMSVIQGAPPTFSATDSLLPPEAAGARAMIRMILPPLVAVIGVLPLLAGRHVSAPSDPALPVAKLVPAVLVVALLVGMWIRYRDEARAWFKEAMEDANRSRRQSGQAEQVRSPQMPPSRSERPSRPDPPALATNGLSKVYGDLVALEPLDLVIPDGQRVVLVGHNGSGKTTLMRMVAGLLEPSAGTATVFGSPAGSLDARAALSYVPDNPVLYDDLSVLEHIEYTCRLHEAEEWEERAVGLLHDMGLTARADDLPSRFSRGLRQKTAIVLALIRPFGLLMVDEPFVGLDPSGREALIELMDDAASAGATVVVATHQLEYVSKVQRCIALRDGALVYDGPPDQVDVLGLVG